MFHLAHLISHGLFIIIISSLHGAIIWYPKKREDCCPCDGISLVINFFLIINIEDI